MRRALLFFSAAARTVRCAKLDPTTADRVRGAFVGALVADALSLATHYEYDATRIRKFYGAVDRYYAPGEKTGGTTHGVGWGARNFHDGNGHGEAKQAGEQTDYGDYNLLVAEHLAATASSAGKPFDVAEFLPRWREALATWRSWICTQTRLTYNQVAQGAPVSSLGGNSNATSFRGAALLGYYDDEDAVADAARKASFTHREATALDGSEFFARVAYRVSRGAAPRDAIQEVAAASSPFVQTKVKQALACAEIKILRHVRAESPPDTLVDFHTGAGQGRRGDGPGATAFERRLRGRPRPHVDGAAVGRREERADQSRQGLADGRHPPRSRLFHREV
jgi:ADP-ribosylglycohydrolase